MTALITGGTGLVGRALLAHLPGAVVLSRSPERASAELGCRALGWDPAAGVVPKAAFDGVDTVFHLAGDPVADGRWTPAKKARIRDSRVLGTRQLVASLAALERRPKVLISASAVGYYGDRGDQELYESASAGSGFLADVCVAWEREALAAEALGIRVVCMRTGIALSRDGGALAAMQTPFKWGAGAQLGDGRQWMPWIHLEDLVGLMLHAQRCDALRGPLNGVSPQPVTNAEFTQALAHALHRPALLRAPAAALRLALGEMSAVLLGSQRALPGEALRTGYRFVYPELAAALQALFSTSERKAA